MNRKALLLISGFVEGGLALLGLVLMRNSGLALSSRFDASWSGSAFALLFCAPLLLGLYLVLRSRWAPLVRFNEEVVASIRPIFTNCRVPDLLLIACLAGFGEELFFRGWLQGVLSVRFGTLAGIVIASAIFGAVHYLSAGYALYAGLTGLYLGAIYQVFGNLYIVMGLHALYDFIALVILVGRQERPDLGPLGT